MTFRDLALGSACLSLVVGCVPAMVETAPPPRLIRPPASAAPSVERDDLTTTASWGVPRAKLDASSGLSLSVQRERTCSQKVMTETGGRETVQRTIAPESKAYQGGLLLIGGLGVIAAVYGGEQLTIGGKSFSQPKADKSGSEISPAGDALIVGGLASLLLIPAVIAIKRTGEFERVTPVERKETSEGVACPPVAAGRHRIELSIAEQTLSLETNDDGQGVVAMDSALRLFGPTLLRAGHANAGSLATAVSVDGNVVAGSTLASALRDGMLAELENEADRRLRVEETRTLKCNPLHTQEFEKISSFFSDPRAARLEPVARVTVIATDGGADAQVKLERGGTYDATVIGRGVRGVEWRDSHGDPITKLSPVFDVADDGAFVSHARQFVAGNGDALRVRVAGDGCALLLVARANLEAPAAGPSGAEPTVDADGRKLIRGPIEASGVLRHVHVVSDSIGVIQKGFGQLTIQDSVISAPICVSAPGSAGLTLDGNVLDCDLGVRFESSVLMGNVFTNNRVRGQMQNIEF